MSDSRAEIAFDLDRERTERINKARQTVGSDDPLDDVSEEMRNNEFRRQQDQAVEDAVRPLADAARLAQETLRSANKRQVGGSHYGGRELQHWDVVAMFGLDYFQGNITKYVFRWRDKKGLEDLEKAKHYLEKYIEEIKAGRFE